MPTGYVCISTIKSHFSYPARYCFFCEIEVFAKIKSFWALVTGLRLYWGFKINKNWNALTRLQNWSFNVIISKLILRQNINGVRRLWIARVHMNNTNANDESDLWTAMSCHGSPWKLDLSLTRKITRALKKFLLKFFPEKEADKRDISNWNPSQSHQEMPCVQTQLGRFTLFNQKIPRSTLVTFNILPGVVDKWGWFVEGSEIFLRILWSPEKQRHVLSNYPMTSSAYDPKYTWNDFLAHVFCMYLLHTCSSLSFTQQIFFFSFCFTRFS